MTQARMECPDCGELLSPEEEYSVRSGMILDAVEDIENPMVELELLAEAAGRFLASVPAEFRRLARKRLISEIDVSTRKQVIAACDA